MNSYRIADTMENRFEFSEPLEIGGMKLRNRVFLAPMSGVSDLPLRDLAWEFGAGLVVSEMVASEALVLGEAEMALKATRGRATPHVVQLAGREVKWMRLGAIMAEANGADIIDINMGCPARRVTTGYSGSALMRDLDHALRLIEATVEAVKVPVTLKMRLGWDHRSINAAELAARAESAGIRMITVHGRTRCQFYKGAADWAAVRQVKAATALPVVVNGDITSRHEAERAMDLSGADAVMIGRGAYGAPWLPGLVAGAFPLARLTSDFIVETAIRHHRAVLSLYGEKAGIRHARKHMSWYLDRLPFCPDPALRRQILTGLDCGAVQRALGQLACRERGEGRAAA